jgi:hypothetical protein
VKRPPHSFCLVKSPFAACRWNNKKMAQLSSGDDSNLVVLTVMIVCGWV